MTQLHEPLPWLIGSNATRLGMSHYRFKALLIISVGFLLCFPSVFSGLFADDYSQALLVQQAVSPSLELLVDQPNTPTLANLFTFVTPDNMRRTQLIEHGLLPWWAAKEFSMVFFRPLAELTHFIDYGYLKQPELMHLHSLLWYGLALLLLALTFRRLLTEKIALLALLFFVLDSTHTFTISWLANRNALMAFVFSLCALLAFRAYILKPNARYLAALSASLVSAFLSAEAGVIAGVLLVSFSLCYQKTLVDSSQNNLQERDVISYTRFILPLALAFSVFVIWLIFYHYWGFGASGNSAYYADPIAEPWVYLKNFPGRFFTAISMLFNILPLHMNPEWQLPTQVVGAVLFVLIACFIVRKNKPHLNFSALLIILSIVPVASAEMQDRNLLFANIGSSIILAELCFFLYAFIALERSKQASGLKCYAAQVTVWLIFIFHLCLSGLFILPLSYAPALLAKPAKQSVNVLQYEILPALSESNSENTSRLFSQQLIFTVGMPLFTSAYIVPMQAYFYPPKPLQKKGGTLSNKLIPRAFINLSSDANAKLNWIEAKTGFSQSFTVQSDLGLFTGPDTLLRDIHAEPFALGERINLLIGYIEISQLSHTGVVQAVQVNLNEGIKRDELSVYRWKSSPIVQFEPAL